MEMPTISISFHLVRKNAKKDFNVFKSYCAQKIYGLPHKWKIYPDGLSFCIECMTPSEVRGACAEVASFFRFDSTLSIRYEVHPTSSGNPRHDLTYYKLLLSGEEVDVSGHKIHDNAFSHHICEKCRLPDFTSIRNPLVISGYSQRILKQKYFMLQCMNGFRVISKELFNRIRNEIEDYVDTGSVASGIDSDLILDNVIWIRPKLMIGANYRCDVIKECNICNNPMVVRSRVEKRAFLSPFDFYKSLNPKAPIVLSGNWFGSTIKEGYIYVVWDILVSGKLLSLLLDLKIKNIADEITPVYGIELYTLFECLENDARQIFYDANILHDWEFPGTV